MYLNRDGRKADKGIFKIHNEHIKKLNPEKTSENPSHLIKTFCHQQHQEGWQVWVFPPTHPFPLSFPSDQTYDDTKTTCLTQTLLPTKRSWLCCFCNREVHRHLKLGTEISDSKVRRQGSILDVHTSSHLLPQARVIFYTYSSASGSWKAAVCLSREETTEVEQQKLYWTSLKFNPFL